MFLTSLTWLFVTSLSFELLEQARGCDETTIHLQRRLFHQLFQVLNGFAFVALDIPVFGARSQLGDIEASRCTA